jgi:hypothetical protein
MASSSSNISSWHAPLAPLITTLEERTANTRELSTLEPSR